jgi:hypothetical protein
MPYYCNRLLEILIFVWINFSVFRDFSREPSIAKKALMRKDLLEIHFPKYFTKFAELLETAGGEW